MQTTSIPVMLTFVLAAFPAIAQETKVPYLTPYPGSEAYGRTVKQFDEYQLMVGPALKAGPKIEKLEGKVARFTFRGPADRSIQEVFVNYEEALRKGGFTSIFRCMKMECGQGDTRELGYFNSQGLKSDPVFYIAARKNRPEGVVYIVVKVERDGPLTRIHVIEPKPMQTGLVQVSAVEMKNDLATTGHVALYNILFDTARAEIKPESAGAIAEVAKLLQNNTALKIHVVGHTDNAGSYESNVDLSKRRAEAVVKELTTKHGIAAARLRAVGVASVAPVASNHSEDGKKQNRRVELVEQ